MKVGGLFLVHSSQANKKKRKISRYATIFPLFPTIRLLKVFFNHSLCSTARSSMRETAKKAIAGIQPKSKFSRERTQGSSNAFF